ncbi:hypothetical protein AN8081.2 [Aspergillus nidulans FGSC A4]|uniref:Uncharacterized protein n=1 Tax=Emericella nidulans (strain FGSC A4 / ATCC 38163 / CBS 112.46 / NRRL 194 / M139) TaxID=227321 RepID=Q5AUE9_EMENI|nr:hypothetical protein [Aspergillus nidulans FGSC A4]EAA59703.1 hypothetical protein AN8081.2 [Aspergillus nidulans FGSC A4]CBF73843.1 TPA: conserved hypothetical protein [Aspergillus nidulans FGSC A4]|eukprot:XP_681350.1 hypothetical protein AN8081.2 [Aspergillus nidulans FGSC A4]
MPLCRGSKANYWACMQHYAQPTQGNSFSPLALALPATITAQAQTVTNCTVFNWDGNNPSITTYPPQRVSGASSCPETLSNLTCALSASGYAQYPGRVNITHVATDIFASVVMETVRSTTLLAPAFNNNVIGSIDATRILRSGQSAYLSFTAYKFCYTGTLYPLEASCGILSGVDLDSYVLYLGESGFSVTYRDQKYHLSPFKTRLDDAFLIALKNRSFTDEPAPHPHRRPIANS